MIFGLSHTHVYWASHDIVLPFNIKGYVSDLGIFKVGDGVTKFSKLTYQNIPFINNWFGQFKPIQTKTNVLCTLYNNCLIGATLVGLGNWADFEYVISIANNSNTKTIWVKFANQIIYTLTGGIGPLSNMTLRLKGKFTCIDYVNKKISYWVEKLDSNGAITWGYGTLNNIDLAQDNHLLLQGQGIADNDIIAEQGMGIYCAISLPNFII